MAPGGSMDGRVGAVRLRLRLIWLAALWLLFGRRRMGCGQRAEGAVESSRLGSHRQSQAQAAEQASGQHLLHDDRATRRYDSSPPPPPPPWPVQQEGGSVRDLSVGWRAED
jgi:hypothetical protein